MSAEGANTPTTRQKREREDEETQLRRANPVAAVAPPSAFLKQFLPLRRFKAAQGLMRMPVVGLGTFRMKGKTCSDAVEHAIKNCGVRLIDTAEGYKNEPDVAEGIKKSGIPREEIFIVTKVSKDSMKSAETVRKAIKASLKNLKTYYIDLLLIHWPGTATSNPESQLHPRARIEAWKVFQEFASTPAVVTTSTAASVSNDDKLMTVRHIGVSNFTIQQLRDLESEMGKNGKEKEDKNNVGDDDSSSFILPEVNQVEVHPYNTQQELRDYCEERQISIQAYTSLGRCNAPPKVLYGIPEPNHPRLVNDEQVLKIAKECSLTAPQVLLRWPLQRSMGVIPKASSTEHLDENFYGLLAPTSAENKTRSKGTWLNEDQLAILDKLLETTTQVPGNGQINYAYKPEKFPTK